MGALTIRGLTKRYGAKTAVDGLDLDVHDGEFFVVLGPSGAGKTTTLKSVAGLIDVDAGEVTIAGQNMTGVEPYHRNVAMAFESYALYPQKTVFENLASPLRSGRTGRYSPAQQRERIEAVTGTLGIATLLDRLPGELSNGQRQRVALGRVLVRPGDVYLLDEPLSHLDAKLRAEMRIELKQLGDVSSTTSLYVTHDYQEALALGDRIAVLRAGRLVQIGTPLEIWKTPADTFVAKSLGQPEINLLRAEVEGGLLRAAAGAIALPVPPGIDLPDGRVRIGLRPRDLRLAPPGSTADGVLCFDGTVRLSERLGRLVELTVDINGQPVVVVGEQGGGEGERVRLQIPLESVHVFAAADGDEETPRLGSGAGRTERTSGAVVPGMGRSANTSGISNAGGHDRPPGRREASTATAQSLTLQGLRKTYVSRGRQSFEAVKGIDLHIEPAELVALLGPSGCGKTTTLRMIAGLETVTSGDIRLGERSVSALAAGQRNIGVGFENYALYPPLNVRENLAYGLKARKVKDADQRVDRLAARLEMTDMLPLRPAGLSTGQKQRVALARALIRNPPVLLLDEPLSHLDAAQRQRVRRELKILQREFGYTTIIVTHDQLEALSLADRIAVMNAGVIMQYGTPDEIFDDPANVFVADFVGEPKINLLSGTVEHRDGQVMVRVGEAGLLVTASNTAVHGQRVVVGIRPQDCEAGLPADAPALRGSVRTFENLLEFGQVSVDVPGADDPLVLLTDAHAEMRRGDTVRFDAPAQRVYLFDPDSGERLR